jgi:hypothetical protein
MPFYNSVDNIFNITISFTPNSRYDFGIFAKGYTNAAKVLTERIVEQTGRSDANAYPIIFLYRHAFELHLKNVIYKAFEIESLWQIEERNSRLYNTHDLIDLAKIVNKLIENLYPNDPFLIPLGEKITQTAKEFHDIDPNSFAYRYPIDREGNDSTQRNQIVNLESIYKWMSKLLDDLESVDLGLGIEIESSAMILEEIFD